MALDLTSFGLFRQTLWMATPASATVKTFIAEKKLVNLTAWGKSEV
jgi:hypothetical protein